jgi:hypothetical protein
VIYLLFVAAAFLTGDVVWIVAAIALWLAVSIAEGVKK